MSTRPRYHWWRTMAFLPALTLCLNVASTPVKAAELDASGGGSCLTADCQEHGAEHLRQDAGHGVTLHVFQDGTWELLDANGSLIPVDGLKAEYMPTWGAAVLHTARAYLGLLVGAVGGLFVSLGSGIVTDLVGEKVMPIPEAESTTYTVWQYMDCRKKESAPGYEAVYRRLEFTITRDNTTTVKAWVEDGGPYLGPYKLAPKTEACYMRFFAENR